MQHSNQGVSPVGKSHHMADRLKWLRGVIA